MDYLSIDAPAEGGEYEQSVFSAPLSALFDRFGELQQVVESADQAQFALNIRQATHQELPESAPEFTEKPVLQTILLRREFIVDAAHRALICHARSQSHQDCDETLTLASIQRLEDPARPVRAPYAGDRDCNERSTISGQDVGGSPARDFHLKKSLTPAR